MRRFLKTASLTATICCAMILCCHARAQEPVRSDLKEAPTTSHPDTTTYTETVLVDFTGNSAPDYGDAPYGSLIQASNGDFYGTTSMGGAEGYGNMFSVTSTGSYAQLAAFPEYTMGEQPFAGVVEGTDGNFYGTTAVGGPQSLGTIFKVTSTGAITVMRVFAGGTSDGADPRSALIQGTDGDFYGTAAAGGTNNLGIVFKISGTSPYSFTILHSFAGTDGEGPEAGLIQGSDGDFYGTTGAGGETGYGTVFKMSPSSPYTVTTLHSFAGGTTDGDNPYLAGLVEGSDGYFYGTTSLGGVSGYGTAFKVSSDGSTYSVLHSFAGGVADGEQPLAGLEQASDGNLYGTTDAGGAYGEGSGLEGYGTVYVITPEGSESLLHSFSGGASDEEYPEAGLVQGVDGSFYSTTGEGGAGYGTVYKLAASPALSAPVQLTIPTSVEADSSFTLAYIVANAYSDTLQQCFATNTAGDASGWVGIKTGSAAATDATLTASSTPGTYIYTLTCGGMETGIATLNVTPADEAADITFTSVTHNMGSVKVGSSTTGSSNYGVKVTNTSGAAITATGISLTGSEELSYQTNCPATLAAGAYCEILFTFAPTATGIVTATWSLAGTPEGTTFKPSNGGALTGTGTSAGAVTLTTNGHNFGTIGVGDAAPTYGTELVNSTGSAVTLSLGSVSSPFSVLTNCTATLPANHSCELEFNFKPTTTGTVRQVYTLSGSGVTITAGGVALPNGGITLTGN
jgi:uncharacterized repeat protein (TIGR03803 family)